MNINLDKLKYEAQNPTKAELDELINKSIQFLKIKHDKATEDTNIKPKRGLFGIFRRSK